MIFLFIDGFGIGSESPNNPFLRYKFPYFPQNLPLNTEASLPYGGIVKAIDACLDTPGIPQSATGQTALFTGFNAAKHLGGHQAAFPDKRLRKIIIKNNLLKEFSKSGFRANFYNAYPQATEILNKNQLTINPDGEIITNTVTPLRRKISVTTTMAVSIHQKFTDIRDMINGEALYQDFTNLSLLKFFPGVPEFSPEKAAGILTRGLHKGIRLFEYFLTDKTAHEAVFSRSVFEISKMHRFIDAIIKNLPPGETLLVTSDHGNIEDASSGIHTRNPVPCAVWGPLREKITKEVDAIYDIFSVLVKYKNML